MGQQTVVTVADREEILAELDKKMCIELEKLIPPLMFFPIWYFLQKQLLVFICFRLKPDGFMAVLFFCPCEALCNMDFEKCSIKKD